MMLDDFLQPHPGAPVPIPPARDLVSEPLAADLRCHPDTPCPAVRSLQARASLLDARLLAIGFTLQGDLEGLLLPAPASPERVDGLWQHTCFEAFLAWEGEEAYRELNLSPSSAWAAYAFARYREGGAAAEDMDPRIVAHARPGRLELHALARLDPPREGARLLLGLSAVVQRSDGGLSYWAIHHPPGPPDFHQAASRTLVLDPAWIAS
jgi:hypothetical protein